MKTRPGHRAWLRPAVARLVLDAGQRAAQHPAARVRYRAMDRLGHAKGGSLPLTACDVSWRRAAHADCRPARCGRQAVDLLNGTQLATVLLQSLTPDLRLNPNNTTRLQARASAPGTHGSLPRHRSAPVLRLYAPEQRPGTCLSCADGYRAGLEGLSMQRRSRARSRWPMWCSSTCSHARRARAFHQELLHSELAQVVKKCHSLVVCFQQMASWPALPTTPGSVWPPVCLCCHLGVVHRQHARQHANQGDRPLRACRSSSMPGSIPRTANSQPRGRQAPDQVG